MCFGGDGGTSDESYSWKSAAGKGESSGGFYSLHTSCVSNAAKNTLSFIKHQRGKLYIVRRCVTMLLWDK